MSRGPFQAKPFKPGHHSITSYSYYGGCGQGGRSCTNPARWSLFYSGKRASSCDEHLVGFLRSVLHQGIKVEIER